MIRKYRLTISEGILYVRILQGIVIMILNYPEERVCTGVSRLGSDKEMMAARIEASREVLDYRHGGVPPRQDDPVVAMAGASTAADVHLNRLQMSSSKFSTPGILSEAGEHDMHEKSRSQK